MNSIEVRHITKTYHGQKAIDDVSFEFKSGKIYGLLGKNGAGKSTLLRIIYQYIFADEGEVLIDGQSANNNEQMQEKVYYMSEMNLYPTGLKVKDILKWTDRFYQKFDIDKAIRLANLFGLDTTKKINQLSTGYKTIFKCIIALSLDIPYIIFDEPVLGLDATHRELFYQEVLKSYEESEKTIIIATHLIEEVSHLIEEVVIIDEGRIVLADSVDHFIQRGYSIAGKKETVDAYCQNENVIDVDELGGMKIAYILGQVQPQKLNDQLTVSHLNLQKLFVKLTSHKEEQS